MTTQGKEDALKELLFVGAVLYAIYTVAWLLW